MVWDLCMRGVVYGMLTCELGTGEPEVEPEVDLSSFLERQRISEAGISLVPARDDADDVDETLAHISSRNGSSGVHVSRKGKVEQIAWDEGLNELSREKASAEATWGTSFTSIFKYTS